MWSGKYSLVVVSAIRLIIPELRGVWLRRTSPIHSLQKPCFQRFVCTLVTESRGGDRKPCLVCIFHLSFHLGPFASHVTFFSLLNKHRLHSGSSLARSHSHKGKNGLGIPTVPVASKNDELKLANMGGCGSKHHSHLETVDDSVHVMLKHDKKKQNEKGKNEPQRYVPRAAHPALEKKKEEPGYVPRAPHPSLTKPAAVATEE